MNNNKNVDFGKIFNCACIIVMLGLACLACHQCKGNKDKSTEIKNLKDSVSASNNKIAQLRDSLDMCANENDALIIFYANALANNERLSHDLDSLKLEQERMKCKMSCQKSTIGSLRSQLKSKPAQPEVKETVTTRVDTISHTHILRLLPAYQR